jgi:O-antigen/teichoic acid export membrane protein
MSASGDGAGRRFVSTSSGLVVARLFGAAVGAGTQLLLARLLTPSALGRFLMISGAAAVIGTAAASGYPSIANRFVSRYRERRPASGLLAAFVLRMRRDTVWLACLAAVAMAAVGLAWPGLDAGTRVAVAAGAPSIPAIAFVRVNGALANAYRRFDLAFLPDLLYRPVLLLGLVVGAAAVGLPLSAALVVFLLSVVTLVVAAIQAVRVRPYLPAPAVRPSVRVVPHWRAAARPLLVVALVTGLFADVDVVMAGTVLPPHDLAIFGICLKIAFLVGFAVQVIHLIAGPDLSDGWVRRDAGQVHGAIGRANALSLAVTLVATLGAALAGHRVLAAFGPHYVAGAASLTVLVAAQVVRAVFGPNVPLLVLCGAQGGAALVFAASLALLFGATLVLVPVAGVLGAALAVLLTLTVSSVALAALLARTAGMRCDAVAGILPQRPAARRRGMWVPVGTKPGRVDVRAPG